MDGNDIKKVRISSVKVREKSYRVNIGEDMYVLDEEMLQLLRGNIK